MSLLLPVCLITCVTQPAPHPPSVCLPLTMLDVLPEDPELGIVLKRDKAALSGGTDLSTNHNTHCSINQSKKTAYLRVCVCVRARVTRCILPR